MSPPVEWTPAEDGKYLLLVACRVDRREVSDRVKTVLAVAATYDRPPDTTAQVTCLPVFQLAAKDLDDLIRWFGWNGAHELNIGSVVAESDLGADCESQDGRVRAVGGSSAPTPPPEDAA